MNDVFFTTPRDKQKSETHNNKTIMFQCGYRSTLYSLWSFIIWLFVITLFFSPDSTMADSDYLFFSIEDCSLAMIRSDSNIDEKLFFGEFLDAAISLSPFPLCPDIESASNIDSSYRLVFEELQCACLDYLSLDPPSGSFDPLCCDRSGPESIRLSFLVYPESYTERLCRGIELALAADCLESSEEPGLPPEGGFAPTSAPTNIPLSQLFPTQAPTPQPPTPGPALPNEEDGDSILGLPTVWTIFAWIAFATCSLVLIGLTIIFLASFCRKSDEKVIQVSDDRNGEEEHEIEFEREEGISENKESSDLLDQQSLAIALDPSAEEEGHEVNNAVHDEDDDEEDFVDASADAGDGDDNEYEEESLDEEEAV